MKTNRITYPVLAVSVSLLLGSLAACDKGKSPTIDQSAGTHATGYDTGYEFGIKLALLREEHSSAELDEAFKGLCDALAETGTPAGNTGLCKTVAASTDSGKADNTQEQKSLPARRKAMVSMDDYATLNASRAGVITLPSTVQYEVLKPGTGKQPKETDSVLISYNASLPDGRIFDTTDGESMSMAVNEIAIPGLKDALLHMNEGAHWRVVIPPMMGFGRFGNNQLRRHDLIYDIELVSIEKPEPAPEQ